MHAMKAVRIHSYGGTDVLVYEDAPRPIVEANDVLIRVHATTVNPFDCAVRAGYMAGYFTYPLPHIPGTDVSGVVAEIGPGVTNVAPGDAVFTRAGVVRDGAYAEYVLANAADVVAKPRSLDHVHAAAIPHAILTAWQALIEAAQLSAGQTVLIHGAAGGVGHLAVQLAKLRGAHVIGTASTNLAFLHELQLDQVIDYAATPFEQVVRDVDVVLDTVGGDTQKRSWAVLKPGGILVSTVQPPSEERAAAYGVRQHFVTSAPPIGVVLKEVAAMVDAGKITPTVSKVLPLHDIRAAHELVERRHMCGKLVLMVAA